MTYSPTHRVPAAGMQTWPAPDPTSPVGPTLGAGLDVEVLEQRDDGWAHVKCSNEWTAWVDGRLLTTLSPDAIEKPSPFVLGGIAAIVVASFLPWVQGDVAAFTAWEMPIKFLLGNEDDIGGPVFGLVLVVAIAYAAVPLLMKRRPSWKVQVALAAFVLEGVYFTASRAAALDDSGARLGVGGLLAVVAAGLFAVDAFQIRRAS